MVVRSSSLKIWQRSVRFRTQCNYESNNPVSVLQLDVVNEFLESFEKLKVSHMELCKIIENMLLTSPAEDINFYVFLSKKAEKIKINLIRNRCNY